MEDLPPDAPESFSVALAALENSMVPVASANWAGLPAELLEIIGAKLTEGVHLHSAAMVCKSWNANIASGLSSMELDMHSDAGMWAAKVERLSSLIRHLRSAIIHVNTSISEDMLCSNLALVQQLKGIEELQLHLRDSCDLPPAAAAAIGSMAHLTSLTISGGTLSHAAATQLLEGLGRVAAAGGAAATGAVGAGRCGAGGCGGCGLRSLTLLPAVQHGLGDGEMAALAAVSSLEKLEFRAHRLTSSGLAVLSMGLPRLTRLAITSLDSDSGYELSCLERLALLAELDLALDHAPTSAGSRRALCAVRPGRSLSLSFRWTERAQGLLTEYGKSLANLTHLDVGACRVGSESLFEAVAQLTCLRELRMAVYSNADHAIPCHLSRLAALAGLQRFHLEKRRAYFPEARRFCESSIAVPVTAEGLRCLALRWSRLRSLRLALSRKDYSPEALTVLSSFTGLRELGLVVERHPAFPQAASAGNGAAATATAPGAGRDPSPGGSGAAAQQEEGTGAGAGPSRPALGRWRVAELPPTLDVNCLPAGLTALELCNLVLDMGPGPRQGRCGAPGTADAGGKGQGAEQQQRQQGPGLDMGLGVGDGERGAPGGASSAGAANLPVPLCAIRGQGGPPVPQAEPAVHQAAAEAEAATPTSPLPSLPSPPPPLPLSQLTRLDVEGCVVRPQLLAALAERVGPSLQSLRLVGVVGLADAALGAALRRLAVLRSLAVSAPGNRAVTQASLAALSYTGRPPLVLRALSWETDDLTARGPQLAALSPLTTLRHLWLSCTDKTAERALGGMRVLYDALPYCHVDVVRTQPREEAR